MAIIEDHLRPRTFDAPAPDALSQDTAPTAPTLEHPAAAERPAGPRELSARWAALLAGAWLVGLTVAAGLEPPPADPGAPIPLSAVLLNVAFFGTLTATMGALAIRRAWAGIGSVAAAGVFTVMVVACPASGHHEYGAWWLGQLAVTAGLLTASVATVKRFSPLRGR